MTKTGVLIIFAIVCALAIEYVSGGGDSYSASESLSKPAPVPKAWKDPNLNSTPYSEPSSSGKSPKTPKGPKSNGNQPIESPSGSKPEKPRKSEHKGETKNDSDGKQHKHKDGKKNGDEDEEHEKKKNLKISLHSKIVNVR